LEQLFYDIGAWMEAIGWWAYLIAPLVMAGVAILPIPAEAPAMINGALFGPIAGTVVTWVGAMAGAMASFEIARALGRPAAERVLSSAALERADRVVLRAGWGGLLLARFLPLIAFTALNWGAGLTQIRRWRFFWTTAIGIVPGAIVFTASGWGFTALLERLPWVALGVAVLLVVWLVFRTRRRTRALETVEPIADPEA
jgi:uncharacterized membrane protein YdjX (TVP38/TMEM64 family)